MKDLKQITFNEALDRVRNNQRVYATDLSSKTLTMKLFNRLAIDDALKSDYVFLVAEEIQEGEV